MVWIMTATKPRRITLTVDGELSSEYVEAVETCAMQALAQRRPTQLFLRDVSTIDESGRALLGPPGGEGGSLACRRSLLFLHRCKNPSIRCVGAYVTCQPYVRGRSLTDLRRVSPAIARGHGLPMCRKTPALASAGDVAAGC